MHLITPQPRWKPVTETDAVPVDPDPRAQSLEFTLSDEDREVAARIAFGAHRERARRNRMDALRGTTE